MALNSNTDLALIDTNTNVGTITLPASATSQGRVLTFKDIQGTFQRNTLTLQTSGSDTFEDGGTSKILRESYGSIQIVASGTKWFLLNGTQVNTVQVSTLIADSISSFNISTINANISTLKFIDNRFSTNVLNISSAFLSTQNVSTNFLYYNNYVIAGTRVGYSNVLNRFSFSPISIQGLSLWFDAADSNAVITSGSNVTQWRDKSQFANHSQILTTNFPQVSTLGIGSISTILFNGANTRFTIPISSSYENRDTPYTLAVVCKPFFGGNNLTGIYGVLGRSTTFPDGLSILTRGYTSNMGFYGTFTSGINLYTWNSNVHQLLIAQRITLGTVNIYDTGTFTSAVGGTILPNSNPFFLGFSAGVSGNYFNGELCEVLFYNASITNFQRQQIEGYLAWKWGLQANLPASHPYKNAPPT